MKKLLSVCSVAVLGLTVADAFAAPSYLKRDAQGGYQVTYDYTDKAKTGWYVGGHAGLSLLNFKNEYSYNNPAELDNSDKYSMEPVFSGSLVGGFRFNYFWRAELELGYIGQFSDKGEGTEFELSAPYAMANVYYDFTNGVYVGAGAGLAGVTTKWDAWNFNGGDRKEMSVSPMVGLMLGYSYELDYNLVLDLRYRLAGMLGHEHDRDYLYPDDGNTYKFTSDTGMILENSFSIGVRYEF